MKSEFTHNSSKPITLEDWIALNDEIAALARAGMPMEKGLLGLGDDLPGSLGAVVRRIAERLEQGQALPEALESESSNLPRTYRAVVEAGLRSGRLAAALEGMAGFARNYLEMRRAIGLALIYPIVVLMSGYVLLLGIVMILWPRMSEAFRLLGIKSVGPAPVLTALGSYVWIWGPILPVVLLAVGMAWIASGRAAAMGLGCGRRLLRWVPGMRGILEGTVAAQFAEWLAMLLEHEVPWSEAVRLAAEATGDASFRTSALALEASSREGVAIVDGLHADGTLPPMLRWVMSAGASQGQIVQPLQQAAASYRRRVLDRASQMRATLPVVLLLVIGASTTFFYAMMLFLPWSTLLRDLAH